VPKDRDKAPEDPKRGEDALAAWGAKVGDSFGELEEMPTTKMELSELEDEAESADEPAPEESVELEESAAKVAEKLELDALPPYPDEGSPALVDDKEQSGPANLEPIGEDAHPPQNRRMPTQPPGALALAGAAASTSEALPPPPTLAVQRSPSPAPIPVRGLFSSDRLANLLAGGALGLCVMIYPAKKIAESYEVREVEPLLTELERSIEQPLAVERGSVEQPRAIVARIDAGRSKTRRRYALVWLLCGLPIGVGLGLAPRPN
jgi:hypothetical protein